MEQLTRALQAAEVSHEAAAAERCRTQIEELRSLVLTKIEAITVHHLVFSDKYAGAKNEVQLSADADGIGFAMWVNLSKNPRIKDIDFPGLKIEISKGIAMSSLAIRVLTIPTKPYNDNFLLLGRLIRCELLQLPTPPKRIGTMTLRQFPHHNQLVTLSYPLKNVQHAQPPLNFRIILAPGFLTPYITDVTVVQVTDDGVSRQLITKVSVDQEANEIGFSSSCVGTFSIAMPRYSHFPLKFWEITSMSETSIEIYLQTQHLELAIVINGDGKVSMESPFAFHGLTPVAAVEWLAERAVNIIAPRAALPGIVAKDADLEEVLAQGIADTVTGFHLKWSRWNSGLKADRAMLLMRPQEGFGKEEEEEEKPEGGEPKNPRMCAVCVKANHVTEVPNTETGDREDLEQVKDTQIHQHLFPLFFDKASQEVQQRVRNVPGFLCDATYYFVKNLRLFSMSQ
jgi:cancer susceptibility candidate protein 1